MDQKRPRLAQIGIGSNETMNLNTLQPERHLRINQLGSEGVTIMFLENPNISRGYFPRGVTVIVIVIVFLTLSSGEMGVAS